MQGILFKPWKQRAIRESSLDKLWQTRRLDHLKEINKQPGRWKSSYTHNDIPVFSDEDGGFWFSNESSGETLLVKPRYRVGETVYIQETYVLEDTYEYHEESLAPTDRPFQRCGDEDMGHYFLIPHYKLSEPDVLITDGEDEKGQIKTRWRSPLSMPAWAARHFLQITSIRPERLQEITEEDAIAEGAEPLYKTAPQTFGAGYIWTPHGYRDGFIRLWDSISPHHPWATNPWCWKYTFQYQDKGG